MTYDDHRNTGTREVLLRARSEGRSLMARRRVTIVYRFSPREDLYARTQRVKFVLDRKKKAVKFIHETRNQNSKGAKIFKPKVMTLQHWVSPL